MKKTNRRGRNATYKSGCTPVAEDKHKQSISIASKAKKTKSFPLPVVVLLSPGVAVERNRVVSKGNPASHLPSHSTIFSVAVGPAKHRSPGSKTVHEPGIRASLEPGLQHLLHDGPHALAKRLSPLHFQQKYICSQGLKYSLNAPACGSNHGWQGVIPISPTEQARMRALWLLGLVSG